MDGWNRWYFMVVSLLGRRKCSIGNSSFGNEINGDSRLLWRCITGLNVWRGSTTVAAIARHLPKQTQLILSIPGRVLPIEGNDLHWPTHDPQYDTLLT